MVFELSNFFHQYFLNAKTNEEGSNPCGKAINRSASQGTVKVIHQSKKTLSAPDRINHTISQPDCRCCQHPRPSRLPGGFGQIKSSHDRQKNNHQLTYPGIFHQQINISDVQGKKQTDTDKYNGTQPGDKKKSFFRHIRHKRLQHVVAEK